MFERGDHVSVVPRAPQTAVKHVLVAGYLEGWTEIIIRGLVARHKAFKAQYPDRPFRARLLYVDGFGAHGRYDGDEIPLAVSGISRGLVWGSPILGTRALDKAKNIARSQGLPLEVCCMIFERDQSVFRELVNSFHLASDIDHTSRVTVDPKTLYFRDDHVFLVHGDFLDYSGIVLPISKQQYTWSFYNLDTFGPTGIPWNSVEPILTTDRVDAMLYFPYQDLHKKQAILGKEQISSSEEKLLLNYDRMFGSEGWREIANVIRSQSTGHSILGSLEPALVNHYVNRLMQADTQIVVKRMRIEFPGSDRPMHHLIFTTHDPCGALRLNKEIRLAGDLQSVLHLDYKVAKMVQKHRKHNQSTIWDLGEVEDTLSSEKTAISSQLKDHYVDTACDLVIQVLGEAPDRSATKRGIYASLVDTSCTEDEIKTALKRLKEAGRINDWGPRTLEHVYKLSEAGQ